VSDTEECVTDDCTAVLQAAYTFLDGEADEATCALIKQHLADCSPCLREFGLERTLKELIARSCGCEEVPADLRAKVVTRITQVQVQFETVERTLD
jgi:mycothiol system anti-sigma-R factor